MDLEDGVKMRQKEETTESVSLPPMEGTPFVYGNEQLRLDGLSLAVT